MPDRRSKMYDPEEEDDKEELRSLEDDE